MINIQIDGQVFPLPEEIAAKDELLKAALAPFVPWIANAQIDRKEDTARGTTVVCVIKRADTKGNAGAVVNALVAANEEMNPALELWLKLQERVNLNDPGIVITLEPTINEAIEAGEKEIGVVQQSLTRLVEGAAAPSNRIPLGF